MTYSKSHKIGFAFAAFALAILLYAALPPAGRTEPAAMATEHAPGRRHNPNLIHFTRGAFDTSANRHLDSAAEDALPFRDRLYESGISNRKRMRVIQFTGAIRREWVERLKATGSEIIGYIPNNAYIIRGTARELREVAALHEGPLAGDDCPIQWMGRFEPLQKIHPLLDSIDPVTGEAGRRVEVELLDSPESEEAIAYINAVATGANRAPRRFLNYVVLSVTLPLEELEIIAAYEEVLFISPDLRPFPQDERSAQIAAGNLTSDNAGPAAPGYLAWLTAKRLSAQPDFLVDFTDSGLDNGSTSANFVHPDFRDSQDRSRVAYQFNYVTIESNIDDRRGHGTLVASAAVGSGNSANTDEAGYLYGIGVDPYVRLGASRIFAENGSLPFNLRFTTVASAAYAAGARISNNSWGNGSGMYDSVSQEYDALTRDAQPAVAGNQEMTFVFSAGNNGAGGRISSPGTAKNVITVGASENYRPEGFDSCNLDNNGGVGPEGADSALDILRFSSGGPTFDGRVKPDIAAPGTHIYGAASQSPFFNAHGLCPGVTIYQPSGQRLYTWSSGTSLAAAHVSGAAALLRRFFVGRSLLDAGRAPSPAMLKAYLLNSTTYMTGEGAGGNLPGERQGYGLLNLGRAFDDERRVLVDQTRLFTESGQTFEITGALADRSRPLRVTLAWTDAPGTLAGAVLSNDLDLEVIVGGATLYRGNVFAGQFSSADNPEPDRLNNVESIFLPPEAIPQGHTGNFTIRIRAANIVGNGVPGNETDLDQDFALAVYNITDPIIAPPPPKTPAIASATYLKKVLLIYGRDFTAAARVEINGKLIEREFAFDPAAGSLRAKYKLRKLNLRQDWDNQIVIIENNERSAPFTLRL